MLIYEKSSYSAHSFAPVFIWIIISTWTPILSLMSVLLIVVTCSKQTEISTQGCHKIKSMEHVFVSRIFYYNSQPTEGVRITFVKITRSALFHRGKAFRNVSIEYEDNYFDNQFNNGYPVTSIKHY